jgi:hypothetical protein
VEKWQSWESYTEGKKKAEERERERECVEGWKIIKYSDA